MRFIYLITLFLLSNTIVAEDLNISSTSGISQGFLMNGVANWDDIPYAQPPVGGLRWKAPRKILESNKLLVPKIKNFCIQKPSGMGGSEFDGDEFFSGSEDCLYLDIKAPKSKSKNLKSRFSFYRDGFLVAGLSPKAIIFFGTIFSSFIDFSGNYLAQFIILMTTYVILDFATLMIYGFAAQKVSVWLKSNPKTLNTISACVLVVIALFIAVTQSF